MTPASVKSSLQVTWHFWGDVWYDVCVECHRWRRHTRTKQQGCVLRDNKWRVRGFFPLHTDLLIEPSHQHRNCVIGQAVALVPGGWSVLLILLTLSLLPPSIPIQTLSLHHRPLPWPSKRVSEQGIGRHSIPSVKSLVLEEVLMHKWIHKWKWKKVRINQMPPNLLCPRHSYHFKMRKILNPYNHKFSDFFPTGTSIVLSFL